MQRKMQKIGKLHRREARGRENVTMIIQKDLHSLVEGINVFCT